MSEMNKVGINTLLGGIMETETTTTTVATQPGWFIARLNDDDEFEFDHIIAWEISRSTPVEPSPDQWTVYRDVTPIGFNTADFRGWNEQCIKKPDGTFELGSCTCADEAEAAEQLRQRQRRVIAAQVKTPRPEAT
jgi:hypothetical protein